MYLWLSKTDILGCYVTAHGLPFGLRYTYILATHLLYSQGIPYISAQFSYCLV